MNDAAMDPQTTMVILVALYSAALVAIGFVVGRYTREFRRRRPTLTMVPPSHKTARSHGIST
jgi:predicted alpha/beta-hydrolase family hydrolase